MTAAAPTERLFASACGSAPSLGTFEVAAALLDADALLLKVAGASEHAEVLAVERRLFQTLGSTFFRRARGAVSEHAAALAEGDRALSEADVERAARRLGRAFDGWADEVAPVIRAAVDRSYRVGKEGVFARAAGGGRRDRPAYASPHLGPDDLRKAGRRRATQVKPSFDARDEAAIASLTDNQVFWIGRHYEENLSRRVHEVASDVLLRRGLGRREAAAAFEQAMAAEFGYDPSQPFERPEGLTIPRGWRGSSVQYFEGLATNTATVGRVTGSMRGLRDLGATRYEVVNPIDERTCERCSFMDGKVLDVRAAQKRIDVQIERGRRDPAFIRSWHRWARSADEMRKAADGDGLIEAGFGYPPFHFRCRCAVDLAADSGFEPEEPAAGFPWREEQLAVVPRDLAGAHAKVLFRAPDGAEWLFKPQDEFRAMGDVMAARAASALGLETAEVHLVELRGRTGSIQRMFTRVAGDVDGVAPAALTEEQALALQREHVFDWLISQHDTHTGNVLRLEDGSLRFIDKGQTFRFFGTDRLDLEYGAPQLPNASGTYYHSVFKAYASGADVPLADVAKLDDFLRKIEELPDEQFLEILRPYAKAASDAARRSAAVRSGAWMGKMSEQEFLDAALARKRGIRDDVARFYRDLAERRARAKPPAIAQLSAAAIREADEAGWAGRSFFVGGPDYEGMSWTIYGADGDGAFLEAKLRASADRRLMSLFGQLGETVEVADPYYDDVLKVAKSFNHHLGQGGDGAVPAHTTEAHKRLTALVAKGLKKPKGSVERQMALHYAEYLEKIRAGDEWKAVALGVKIDRFVAPPTKPTTALPAGWKVERAITGELIQRELRAGRLVMTGTSPTRTVKDVGPIYRLTSPDGVTVVYRPHSTKNPYAVQGEIRVWIDAPMERLAADPARARRAVESLKALGLETAEATDRDLELLYLRKIAFKEKLDDAAREAVAEDLPIDEQIRKLKAFLGDRAGVKFGAGYEFRPTFDAGGARGRPRWLAHYIDDDATKDVRPHHHLYHGVEKDLAAILDGGTRSLVPTREKVRLSIPVSGMSPEEDLKTGGGSYVFTRLREGRSDAGLYFKPGLMRDLDAVTYERDMFGRVRPVDDELGTRHVRSEWRRIARRRGSDETIFKDGINLETWLDEVVVESEAQRKRVLKLFKERGIKVFAGKRVEDLVQVAR